MVEHKWGTSTKEGDAFPNVPVDIGFAGLDPTNRKMSGDLNKGKGAASEKSPTCACARTCAMEPAGRPRAAALGRPWNATRAACGGPRAWASGVSALSCFPRRSEDALGDAAGRLHAHLIHVPGAKSPPPSPPHPHRHPLHVTLALSAAPSPNPQARCRRQASCVSRAHLTHSDPPLTRSLASRKPRSKASLRRRGSTRCTTTPLSYPYPYPVTLNPKP